MWCIAYNHATLAVTLVDYSVTVGHVRQVIDRHLVYVLQHQPRIDQTPASQFMESR